MHKSENLTILKNAYLNSAKIKNKMIKK